MPIPWARCPSKIPCVASFTVRVSWEEAAGSSLILELVVSARKAAEGLTRKIYFNWLDPST